MELYREVVNASKSPNLDFEKIKDNI